MSINGSTCKTCEYFHGDHCGCISECVDRDLYIGIDWTDEEKFEAYQNRFPYL